MPLPVCSIRIFTKWVDRRESVEHSHTVSLRLLPVAVLSSQKEEKKEGQNIKKSMASKEKI